MKDWDKQASEDEESPGEVMSDDEDEEGDSGGEGW